jgi:hypothetical protein
MSEFGLGRDLPALNDITHFIVYGDFPTQCHWLLRHTTVIQGVRRETRPDHDTIR